MDQATRADAVWRGDVAAAIAVLETNRAEVRNEAKPDDRIDYLRAWSSQIPNFRQWRIDRGEIGGGQVEKGKDLNVSWRQKIETRTGARQEGCVSHVAHADVQRGLGPVLAETGGPAAPGNLTQGLYALTSLVVKSILDLDNTPGVSLTRRA